MKKILVALAMTASVLSIGCTSKSDNYDNAKSMNEETNHKVLVAYFSATGTTKAVAEEIANATDGTLYEIAPVPAYTDADLDWRNKQSRSSVEMEDNTCRPEIGGDSLDVTPYDIVFVGYPIWWDLAPRQVNTFLEKYDLKGKTIIPFATSGGSTISHSVAQLKKLYPDYDIHDGRLLNEDRAIAEWAKSQVN